MPTDAELRAKYLRDTENAKLRMRALRARRRAASRNGDGVRVTNASPGGAGDANPPTPPVSSISKEIERIRALLTPFADRAYVHSVKYWHLAAALYPALCLEMEAEKLAEWLLEPRNLKEKCSKRRIDNWLARAEVRRQQRQAEARQVPATTSSYQAPVPRPSPGKPPDPAPVLPADVVLERIDPAVAQRALAEARRLTLPEKLALAKNGRGG